MGIFNFFKKGNNTNKEYKVGDTLFFGKYFFNNEKDIKPIEWIVLQSYENELLLISKYCLDTIRYCEPSATFNGTESCIWENSYLRNWLNNEFFNQAFTEDEKKNILVTTVETDKSLNSELHKNKVFVLSKEQVLDFFPNINERIGVPTLYALKKGANVGHNGEMTTWWWILPNVDITGGQPPRMDFPSVVCQDGEINYHSRLAYHSDFTVRPVIKIKK